MTIKERSHVDAVVIGAGITGIYQVYLLAKAGFSVRGYDVADDVGGTWYWNRYPGCRLDTESYAYGYFSLSGIVPEWHWSERFAGQPELLRYVKHAADHMRIRPYYQFGTRVVSAHYADEENLWRLTLEDGSTSTCTFLLTAVGPLSASRLPDIPGLETFAGASFHSANWPDAERVEEQDFDFSGMRVGVIGTGATGVQIISAVAKSAQTLHVFQRTPNWCTPLGNYPLTRQQNHELIGNPNEFLAFIKSTETAFPYQRMKKKGTEVSTEEADELYETLYNMPGYGIWLAGYRDLLTNRDTNRYLGEFIANKIRMRVKNPEVAEKLIPRDHGFGTRRVPMETNYYEVYNQDNVELVDIREIPISRINSRGVVVGDREIDLDVLILATGFDAVTGALDRIDIRGRGGRTLKETWEEGPVTYLGLQTIGFPNLFTLVGPHNGAAFCNIGVCGALQVEWMTEMLEWLRERKLTCVEPEPRYQENWTAQVYDVYSKTLLADTDAWWVKVTRKPDGSVRKRALIYIGSAPDYRERCRTVAEKNYEGFILR